MSNNNTDDPNNFNDDEFDVSEDFSDIDFDEPGFDEAADFSEDVDSDLEYSDEDFAEDEWQDDDLDPMAANAGNQKLYRGGKEKKSFLSFNAIVIICAVVVGCGVLVSTVMNKTEQLASSQGSVFRSMLNIGEIMDGRLFGNKEEAPQQSEGALVTATDAPSDGGFLNNPEQLNPPQPSPIASPETQETVAVDEPLTPMPEEEFIPRGPAEIIDPANTNVLAESESASVPTSTNVVTEEKPNKAEALLKEAMANRDTAINAVPAEPEPVQQIEEQPALPVEPVAPAPVVPPVAQVEPLTPAVNKEAEQEISNLKSELAQSKTRINTLETELSILKKDDTSSEATIQNLQATISKLEAKVKTLNEREVTAPAPKKEAVAVKEAPVTPKKKATPAPKKAAVAKPATSAGAWELRAAQPGKAWVSKSGEREMKGVQVGDNLPGIGQVTAIVYQGGRWTVQGTQGQIRQ
jgi:hypothetical protein